jgi:hypothetical protein
VDGQINHAQQGQNTTDIGDESISLDHIYSKTTPLDYSFSESFIKI